MSVRILSFLALITLFVSCNDDDARVFEKDADTRAAEAVAALKEKLMAPPDGWLLKYRPESGSGSYYVLLKFNDDNTVNIKTDLGIDEGEYFDQTITYRIDNSLGLELIFENYSFFSYLFEQDQASFGAEFEFNYVNETGDGDLVFNSKSDVSSPTVIALQQAVPQHADLLGVAVSENISKMTEGLAALTTVLKLSYTQKDVALYLNLDDFRRTITINYISSKSSSQNGQKLNFSSPYILEGNSIILDEPLTGSFMGNSISIESIRLDQLTSSVAEICADTLNIYNYTGSLSSNDQIVLETSIFDPEGSSFNQSFEVFRCPLRNIFDEEGFSAIQQIEEDIEGALELQMYFIDTQNGPLEALGFSIQNANASITFALRDFTYILDQNRIQFDFAPDYTLYGDTTATVNPAAMNKYLDIFSEGGNTYIYRYSDTIYEFYNPCNGWSFFFFAS